LDSALQATGPAEAELVRSARTGDTDAFAQLVRLYQRRAVSLAYRIVGNGEDAKDVSQDAFIRAYRNLGQLQDPSRFGSWLLRVVSNLSLNFRRSRKLRLAVSLDEGAAGSLDDRNPVSGRPAVASLEDEGGPLTDELRRAIDEAMEELPDKQRLALILFSVEGMPQKQVAEVLECSVELVKWNVFQARQKLKELLADYL